MRELTRPSRIVRRIVMTLAVVVLLVVGYVGSWLAVSRAVNHRTINADAGAWLRLVFKPLILYCDLKQPGSDTLHRLWWAVSADFRLGDDLNSQPGRFLSPSLPKRD